MPLFRTSILSNHAFASLIISAGLITATVLATGGVSAQQPPTEETPTDQGPEQPKTAPNETPAAESAEPENVKAPSGELMAAIQAGPRALSLAFRMAAKRATQSVVVLYVYGQNPEGSEASNAQTDSSPDPLPLLEKAEAPKKVPLNQLTGLGSGVVLSADGLVVTNNHVIRDAKRVVVQLPDETKLDAEVIRGDPESDIAIVRITSPEVALRPVEIGDSDRLEIGDWVLAIGSPFKLEATVSAGIISGKNRPIDRIKRSRMLQTDAAINPGNSGGALIDLDGKLVGISTAIASRNGFYQGVGFAIPVNQAAWIARELDEHGEVRRAAIGTRLADLKPRIARKFDLPPNSGILVYQIIKDSVAQQAGIEPLDVIIEFAGERVRDSASLQQEIERQPIGSMQPIVVRRAGKRVELMVKLAAVDDPTGRSVTKAGDMPQ